MIFLLLGGFSRRCSLLEVGVSRMQIEKANCGSTLSKRIRRLRRNAAVYYGAGNVVHISRSVPDSVAVLRGHRRACAEVCVICWQVIAWKKKAYYLPENSQVVDTIVKVLQLNSTSGVGISYNLPSSCHVTCYDNIRFRPRSATSASASARLRNIFDPDTIPIDSARTRRDTSDSDAFDNCSICRVYESKNKPPRKRPRDKVEVKLADKPEEGEHALAVPPASPFVVSQNAFARAVSVCGMSTKMALDFAAALEMATANEGTPLKFEPGMRDAMYALNKMFESFTKQVNLTCGEGAAVVMYQWEKFYLAVCESENVSPDDLLYSTWSVDHGRTSLKVTVSLKWRVNERPTKKQCSPARLRKLTRTGVRKLYVIALVTGVKETYTVLQSLLGVLDLPGLKNVLEKYGAEIGFVNDQKMSWILHGKSHGGLHPCNYCPWTPNDGLGTNTVLRTPLDDQREYERWKKATAGWTFAKAKDVVKQYNNCIRPSVIANLYTSQEDKLIDISRPMPLHLKLRNGNHLCLLLRNTSQPVCEDLLKQAGVVVEKYHKELEGGRLAKFWRQLLNCLC